MRTRKIGSSGIDASVVGLGTWAIGGWLWGGSDEADSINAIRAALDCGITLIDTAPVYGQGVSEEVVGKAIKGRREQVVLATKCGLVWHETRGTHYFNIGEKAVYKYLGADSIRYEVEQSLRRLQTDYIDLYQTHWQDSTAPITETMGALLELKKEGMIRAIGVSNASIEQIKEYEELGKLDSAQERYSMLDRGLEQDRLPYCREHGISLLAYSPLALGLLTGRIGPEREFEGDDLRKNNKRFSVENRRKVAALLAEFAPVAAVHNATSAQIVIAWTLAQPGMTFVLCGARKPQHASENAKAGDLVLSPEELALMDAAIVRHATDIP
jgi:aryl-alcohol dehydrogenase-like predicted oxidoreductase